MADAAPPFSPPRGPVAVAGSRRRRLWDLSPHAHCPVLGLCLPMRALRGLADRTLGGLVVADDHELHHGAVTEAKTRNRLSEHLQRALERRHAGAIRQLAPCKSAEELLARWRADVTEDVGGALWAVLTHARCDLRVEEQVLRDVHLLQHRRCTEDDDRAERLQAQARDNTRLRRELEALQGRTAQTIGEQASRIECLQAEVLRLRAELIGRDTLLAQSRESLRELEHQVPQLPSRLALVRQNERLTERLQTLERAVNLERVERLRTPSVDAGAVPAEAAALDAPPPAAPAQAAASLAHRAVLCVGGRSGSVPAYRALVEETGAQFLHHDGGAEDNVAQLAATLPAADLVICQTGCVSHDAYWRVKDHCKRTGTPCVFVAQPSRAGLQHALRRLAGEGRQNAVIALHPRR